MEKSIFKCNISNFCKNEMAPINLIYLPLTLGVPNGEKFVDKAFKSIKYSHFPKVDILAIFIQSFNILPKALNPKCYTILESIFDAYEGGKVKSTTFRSF